MNRRLSTRPIVAAAILLALAATARGQWVEDSIDVGGRWVGSLAYNSREDVVYGASEDDIFFAIDCSSNRVIAQIALDEGHEVVYDSIDNKAYCTFGYPSESLLVIDGHSHTRIMALPLPSEYGGGACAWSSTLNRLYVACEDNDVLVLDCAADTVVTTVRVGRSPNRPIVNERHRKLYVPNHESESVSIVDLEANEVIRTIRLDNVPGPGCYSYASDKFYLGLGAGSEVVVVDGIGDSVLAEIGLPQGTGVLAATAVETEGLVMFGTHTGVAIDTVYVVNAVCDSVVSALAVGSGPYASYWSSWSHIVYCANGGSHDLSVIAEDGTTVVGALRVSSCPISFSYSMAQRRLYVGHLASRQVYVIRDTAAGIADSRPMRVTGPGVRVAPSPFRDVVTISIPPGMNTTAVRIYGHDGRLVRVLEGRAGEQCTGSLVWNGIDDRGSPVPRGVYLIMVAGESRVGVPAVKLE